MARLITTPARELPAYPAIPRRQSRRFWSRLLLFTASVLLVNGMIGERGLLATLRAKRTYAGAAQDLARLRHENEALRERARRLRHDLETIEAVARADLGLAEPGEIVVTVRDLRQPAR